MASWSPLRRGPGQQSSGEIWHRGRLKQLQEQVAMTEHREKKWESTAARLKDVEVDVYVGNEWEYGWLMLVVMWQIL